MFLLAIARAALPWIYMGFIKVKLWINDCWLVSRGSYTNQYSNSHNPSTGNPYPTSTESDGVGSFLYTAKGCVLKMGKPERKPWKGHGFDFYVFSWDDNQQWLICWNLVSPFLPYPGMMYICLFTIAIYLRWDEVASKWYFLLTPTWWDNQEHIGRSTGSLVNPSKLASTNWMKQVWYSHSHYPLVI